MSTEKVVKVLNNECMVLTDLSSEPVAINLAQGLKVADTEWD